MKAVYQTRFGGSDAPEDEQGNCLQAALASIFEVELEQVPDFAGEIKNGHWFLILERWLATMNLCLYPALRSSGHPMGLHLMVCKSTTLANPDDGHVVVIENGRVVHNPHPRATSIGECQQYWVITALNPAKFVRKAPSNGTAQP